MLPPGTGRVEIVSRYLDTDGKPIGGATNEQLKYGFVWACEYGHPNVIKFLLDRGIKADGDFPHGETGLHWAAFAGEVEIVDLLLKANAPVNLKDRSHGGTPLGWTLYGWSHPAPEWKNARHHEVVESLIRAGATADREWIQSVDRGALASKLRADARMMAALNAAQ